MAAGTSHKERGTGLENRAQLLVTGVQTPTIPLLGEATGSIQGHWGGDSLHVTSMALPSRLPRLCLGFLIGSELVNGHRP